MLKKLSIEFWLMPLLEIHQFTSTLEMRIYGKALSPLFIQIQLELIQMIHLV